MKKVCHVSDIHQTKDQRIFLKECISLKNDGYDVVLFAVGNSEEFKGILINGLQPTPRMKRYFGSQKMLLEKICGVQADLYHLHDPELLRLVKKLKKRTKAKIVFDSHEDYAVQLALKNNIFVRKVMHVWYRIILNKAKPYLDGFIFPCENKRIQKEILPLKLTLVNNFPILDAYNIVNSEEVIPSSMCYVGSITRDRGIVQAIKASYKAGITFVLAGNCEKDFLDELKQMPEWACVSFFGKLTHEETIKLVSKCKIGCCCFYNVGQYSSGKNFGTKVYEYWLCNLPVMLNTTKYNAEMNEKYQFAILVDNIDNIEDYASKIKSVMENPNLQKQLASNGRAYVINEANWEKDSHNLLDLYKELFKDVE